MVRESFRPPSTPHRSNLVSSCAKACARTARNVANNSQTTNPLPYAIGLTYTQGVVESCDRLSCFGRLILRCFTNPARFADAVRDDTLRGCGYAESSKSSGGSRNRESAAGWSVQMPYPMVLLTRAKRGSALTDEHSRDSAINNNSASFPGAYIPLNRHHA